MRRGLLVFLLAVVILVTFAIHSVFTLLTLLFEDASADAIPHSEFPPIDEAVDASRPAVIPKIIHQTYINESIPTQWQTAQQSCLELHPDYEYILWTDSLSHSFIQEEYPWFLDTFDSYPHNIQRADAIRYFVLARYGGIYIDLDDGCNRRLDPLLSYNAWLRRTIPTGISNDAMGAVPNHPFFVHVTESLKQYNRGWVLPYITIMGSTGPLFLSVLWKKWMSQRPPAPAHGVPSSAANDWPGRVRVLMPADYRGKPYSFFLEFQGSSWHGGDAKFIFWMGRNWVLLTVLGFLLAAVVGVCAWWTYTRLLYIGSSKNMRRHGHSSPQLTPVFRSARRGGGGSGRGLGAAAAWWSATGWGRWTNKQAYELVEQHDA